MRRSLCAAAALLALLASTVSLAAAPTCVVGVAGVAPSATLKFVPPTTNTDSSPVATPLTYNLYASLTSGAEVKVASGLQGSPIAVTSTLIAGTALSALKANTSAYFEITTVDANGIESALSNEVCKTFPASTPGMVTITIS